MNSEILFALIRKNAFLEENYPISSDTKLIEDLEYDSVKLLGLIVAIENEFELSIINNISMYKFFSVETIADLEQLLIEMES